MSEKAGGPQPFKLCPPGDPSALRAVLGAFPVESYFSACKN